VYDRSQDEQNSGKGATKDMREANENIRKAQDEEETTNASVDPRKAGNKPRFDRDR
jgi:hypothetical protein